MKSLSYSGLKQIAKRSAAASLSVLAIASCAATVPPCDTAQLTRQFEQYSAAASNPGTETASRALRSLYQSARSSSCQIPELILNPNATGADERQGSELSEAQLFLTFGSKGDSLRSADMLSGLLYHKDERTRRSAAHILYEYALLSALNKVDGKPVVDLGIVTRARAARLLPEGARKRYLDSFAPESQDKKEALRTAFQAMEELAKI